MGDFGSNDGYDVYKARITNATCVLGLTSSNTVISKKPEFTKNTKHIMVVRL